MMERPERAGRVKMSLQSLHMLLDLPPDHKIVAVHPEEDFSRGESSLYLVVVGPLMPEVEEGRFATEVTLTYERKGNERARLIKVEPKGDPLLVK